MGINLAIRSWSPLTSRFPSIIIPTLAGLPDPLLALLIPDHILTLAKRAVTYYFPFLVEKSSSGKAMLNTKAEFLKVHQACDIPWGCHSGWPVHLYVSLIIFINIIKFNGYEGQLKATVFSHRLWFL